MLSARANTNENTSFAATTSKTPARGKTPARRVAFGDISNRKQQQTTTPAAAFKKSAKPTTTSKTSRRGLTVVKFKLDEEDVVATKPAAAVVHDKPPLLDDDDDDTSSLGIPSGGHVSSYQDCPVTLDANDWKDILAEEQELLDWDHECVERRRTIEDQKIDASIEHLHQSIAAMCDQDELELDMQFKQMMNQSYDRSIDLEEEEGLFLDIGF